MNTAERLEFQIIREDQARLHREVNELDGRIAVLTRRLESDPLPKPEPPPLPARPRVRSWYEEQPPVSLQTVSEPPPVETPHPEPPSAAPAPEPTPQPEPQEPSAAEPSLELRVGTYWMARIGIVILLTGLVFLGNYAYHRIVPLLGPLAKLSFIAFAGAALAGLGARLERSRESLRHFGRVLLAGGAATLYYAAYAAHFVEALRVIESPVAGGALLLALTGVFIWRADRRRSEAVAVPAVLLAYYTSAINAVGGFTLFSNLVLSAVAVFFLARHRWLRLSQISLVATYASYGFWRASQWAQSGTQAPFTAGLFCLGACWLLFSAAAFLAASRVMPAVERIGFVSLNNGAFFAFAALHFQQQRPDVFWIFCIGFGAVLLAGSALAARLRRDELALDGTFLAHGLASLTLGFAARLDGPQLAIVLAVESVVLLGLSRRRQALLYEIGAGLCALGAAFHAQARIQLGVGHPLIVAGPVAAILLAEAWWVKRLRGEADRPSGRALGFALLGLGLVASLIWELVPVDFRPGVYALAAVAGLVTLRFRLVEIAGPSQAFLAGAVLLATWRLAEDAPAPWWMPAPVIAVALGLMHWWPRQRAVVFGAGVRSFPEFAWAAAAVFTGIFWLREFFPGERWLVASSAAASGTLLYGLLTNARMLAATGQVFTVLSVASFASSLFSSETNRWCALAPVLNLAFTAVLASRLPASRFAGLPEGFDRDDLVRVYRIGTMLFLGAWAFVHVPADWRSVFFATMGGAQILLGAVTASPERRATGGVYAVAGLALFWGRFGSQVLWLELAAILFVPASLRIGRRLCGPVPVLPAGRDALVAAAMASLWLWSTRWMIFHGHGAQLTAGWAVLALAIFAGGLGLRERVYRLGGFGVLALALGRLFFIDVWRFDTLPRIASFLVLGVVLLTLSFVYHRFAETLRRWL